MMKRWSVTDELLRVHLTQVFSGGACNIIDADGTLVRNSERDRINDWITEQQIVFFDPQIHPATHGYEYDYVVHHPLEIAARQAASVNLYEISPFTFGGITALEIAVDHIRRREPTIIYYSDGIAGKDEFPPHKNGNPRFQPPGILDSEPARQAHYREFRKLGTNMRRYIIQLAHELNSLTVTFGEAVRAGDVTITPHRMHAVDMFAAAVNAANGKRVILNFVGDDSTRDTRGMPMFMLPDAPGEIQLGSLLDQYIDEGCQLRQVIADLVQIGVFLRVVYTQASAILALDEMLKYVGIKPYEYKGRL